MALLCYTNPTDIPAYGGWDFPVFAADIALRAEDMRDVYAAYLENHRRYHSNIPKHWGRYAEAQRVAELHAMLTEACEADRDVRLDGHDLHAMLTEACEADRDVRLDGHDYVWSFSSGLMFNRQFVSARCSECDEVFGPEACRVVEWSFGGGLAAEGGRRVVCPADHTLYSCMEWNS